MIEIIKKKIEYKYQRKKETLKGQRINEREK